MGWLGDANKKTWDVVGNRTLDNLLSKVGYPSLYGLSHETLERELPPTKVLKWVVVPHTQAMVGADVLDIGL